MTRFEKEYQLLNTAQKQAVDTIDGPLLVIAGPGTGKTQLLSLRVANILKLTDVQPYNILCLTYTESGKKAMIERLIKFIGKAGKQVEVNTFHGFGTRLIQRFPDYFPELARFRPAEDLTLYEVLRSCLQQLSRTNPLSKQAYGQYTYQIDARDRISQLKRAGISPDDAMNRVEADSHWCKTIGIKLVNAFQKAGRLSPKIVSQLTSDLDPIINLDTDSDLGKATINELCDAIKNSHDAGNATALSAFKKKWFVGEDGKLYFKPADQIKKLRALAELYIAYENELKKQKIYDYDDMILFSLEKLKQNKEFLAQVQETFQFILADEFQDTNAAQAEIINLIADNPVNEGRPNVMVVGDDDQAIYGFQGAMVDVLMDFRERWRDVNVITLKDNYRSTASILRTARAIIMQGQNRLENNYEDIDKTLTPRTDYINASPSLIEAASPQAVVEKAVQTAKSSDSKRQLAIISTKHKYLLELAESLDAAKIDYYYEGREDLLKDPGLTTLLKLADVILSIKQKDFKRTNYFIPELIAIEAIKIPRKLVWKIALAAKTNNKSWWEVMIDRREPEIKSVVQSIKSLSKSISKQDAVESLKAVAKQLHLRVVQKIKRLNSHATTYFGRDEISLSELLRYSELCLQAGVTLEHTLIKGNKQAPVVLLSAHRSKGLEFDRVYILHADYYTWFKEGGRRNNLVLPVNWQSIEPTAANNDERLRLLYVVMTRAKQELALIKSDHSQLIPGLEEIKVEKFKTEHLEVFNISTEPTWRSWYLPKTKSEKTVLKQLLEPALESYHLSPTHLTMYLDVGRNGPTAFFTIILLGIPEPVHPEAIFGSNVHKSLRFAQDHLNNTGNLPSKRELMSFVKKEITIDESRIEDITQVVYEFITHSRVIQTGGVGEYSFSAQNIKLGKEKLTGNVDHFVIKDNRLVVTDYKTGRALNSWRISEDYYKQKLHRFRQQLLFYELLFMLSPQFNFKTVNSKVAFVEPSRREIYYELKLDADQTERKRLESLISALWQNIMNLDFPEVTIFGEDMNGLTAFEDFILEK